ncbi:MAG: rhodanese-like domain-containing protein [Lutibacter sp.]
MKKLSLILIGLLLIPTLFLTSCDKGDDVAANTAPAFTLLKDHMLANNLDITKILTSPDGVSFVQGAPAEADLQTFLNKYYIVDIRSAADFAAKHITGAKNVAFANILAEGPLAGAKPILVVCYTGQTACYGTALLRMYGYKNTQALKWGMSGWNSTTAGSWNGKIGVEIAKGHANWTYDSAPSNLVFTNPVISTLSTDGAAIFKSRVEAVVAEGFKTVSGTDVLNTPNNYFVNNYFSAADYSAFGHIKNAYRINPLTLADNSYLALDPSAKVVTYCYTGQTSAVITACLRVMGYDAYSLSFGVNGLYNTNSAWTSNQWGVAPNLPKNLPFATN